MLILYSLQPTEKMNVGEFFPLFQKTATYINQLNGPLDCDIRLFSNFIFNHKLTVNISLKVQLKATRNRNDTKFLYGIQYKTTYSIIA